VEVVDIAMSVSFLECQHQSALREDNTYLQTHYEGRPINAPGQGECVSADV
jgi:hypothetical protein